jgi:cytochrome oxidase Cu insertion factor (SCO1/SenC/PrrC family)
MTEAPPRDRDRPRRRTLLILVAVLFLGPLAIASFFYAGTSWRPDAGVARGTLFDPVAKLPVVDLRNFAGTSLPDDSLDGLWILAYLSQGPCEIECQKSLYDTRQVRVLLAEKDRRVRRLLIAGEPLPDPAYLSEYHPDLVIATAASAGSDFIQAFGRDLNDKSDQDILQLDRVYIVDPLGNLVMAYESGFDAEGLLKDLKRLLRLSRIG